MGLNPQSYLGMFCLGLWNVAWILGWESERLHLAEEGGKVALPQGRGGEGRARLLPGERKQGEEGRGKER